MRRTILIASVVLLFSSGCSSFFEQEAEGYELPYTPQLVMYALVIPQDSIAYATVDLLSPADGPNAAFDASEVEVTLEVNGLTVPFSYQPSDRFVVNISTLNIAPGTAIGVTATWNELRAAGTSVVPNEVPLREQVNGQFASIDGDNQVQIGLLNPSLTVEGYALIHDQLRWNNGQVSGQTRSLVDFLPSPPPATDTLFFRSFSFNRTQVVTEPANQAFVCYAPSAFIELQSSRIQYASSAENPFSETDNLATNLTEGVGNVSALSCVRVNF